MARDFDLDLTCINPSFIGEADATGWVGDQRNARIPGLTLILTQLRTQGQMGN